MSRDWNQTTRPAMGRIVWCYDGVESYWTPLAKGEHWKRAAMEFACDYDHGDCEDGVIEAVSELQVNGQIVDRFRFRFGPQQPPEILP